MTLAVVSPRRPIFRPPPAPAPHRNDSEQIVQAVLAAAVELGPEATLAALAERAGVGRASLHRYFPTTRSLFAEVSRRTYRTLVDQVDVLLRRTDLDLRAMVFEICRVALDGPGIPVAYRQRVNLEIPLAWSRDTAETVYAQLLGTIIGWIRRNCSAIPQDLDARVFAAFGAVRGAVLMTLLFPALAPPREVLLQVVADSVYGLLTVGAVDERATSR